MLRRRNEKEEKKRAAECAEISREIPRAKLKLFLNCGNLYKQVARTTE